MEKERKFKFLVIVALMFAIVAVTLGFAAFSKVLTINASATVMPNEEGFSVVLSGSKDDPEVTTLIPKVTGGATAKDAVIINNFDVSTVSAEMNFSRPGQSVIFTSYVHNVGSYDAFVKKYEFRPVDGYTVNKVCIPDEGTDVTLVAQACESIVVALEVELGSNYMKLYETTQLSSGALLEKSTFAVGSLVVSYLENGVMVDGPFSVMIGDINIHYSSVQ